MKLKGEYFEQIRDALLDAFDPASLQSMARTKLEITLDEIVTLKGTFRDQVEDLIRWAEVEDRVPDLITAARSARPTNGKLREAEAAYLDVSGDTAVPRAAILFDQSHGQADWWFLPPTLKRGYKALEEGLGGDYDVAVLDIGNQLTREALSGYDVFVLGIGPEKAGQLAPEEQNAIKTFVENGGGLLVLGNYTGDWHHEANFNKLIDRYGIFLEENIITPAGIETPNRIAYEFSSDQVVTALPVIEGDIQSALLKDIRQVATLTACSLYVDPRSAVPLLLADQAQAHRPIPVGITKRIDGWRPDALETIPLAAVCTTAKVVVAGSRKMFLNEFVEAEAFDNMQFFQNIIQWLAA